MKISTSPRFVVYTDFTDCTIKQALLHSLQTAEDNLLTLNTIWNMRVNGNRLIWSYGKAIQLLRNDGYNIVTTTKHLKNNITTSEYKLLNPFYNWTDYE